MKISITHEVSFDKYQAHFGVVQKEMGGKTCVLVQKHKKVAPGILLGLSIGTIVSMALRSAVSMP